jgi:hypothetical protein
MSNNVTVPIASPSSSPKVSPFVSFAAKTEGLEPGSVAMSSFATYQALDGTVPRRADATLLLAQVLGVQVLPLVNTFDLAHGPFSGVQS